MKDKKKFNVKESFKKFWKWARKEVLNKKMIVFILIAEAIFWAPWAVCALLAIIVNPWWWTAVGAITAFWAGPFTPAVPLQLGLAYGLKKLWEKIRKHKTVKEVENEQTEGRQLTGENTETDNK